jgi:uncharacterized membrane protein YkvA (DUF1232 family)
MATDSTLPAELPSSGLLSFYDRLRRRIEVYCERRAGRLGRSTAEALLLVPDIFILLVRLALDPEVPKHQRTLIASALAYFVLPLDLFPEAMLGPLGFMDDLLLATGVLAQAFGGELEPWTSRHWSGSRNLREVLGDIGLTARSLIGESVSDRVDALLARYGVDLGEEPLPDREERSAPAEAWAMNEDWPASQPEEEDEPPASGFRSTDAEPL